MGRVLIIPLALLLVVAGAFYWSGGSVQKPADFVFINRGDIGTLDPKGMSWLQDIRMAYALFEGLYTLDPQTLQAVPGAAGQIDISPDKTVYTFHIRPEARWSNGEPLTADDFVFAWRRSLDDPGDYTYLMTAYVRGAKDYSQAFMRGDHPSFAPVGMEVLDPKTLRVTLNHPVTFFPELCAFPPFFPLNRKKMQEFADKENADPKTGRITYKQNFTRPPNLVGNGPYRLVLWDFKRRIRLEANEYYWDRAHVRSRVIESLNAADPQWSFLTYESGEVDWLSDLTGDQAADLRALGRKDLHIFPGFGTYFYSLNCQPELSEGARNPLADARVRQALSMAINRQVIVDNITRLGEPIASTFIPPGLFKDYQSPRGLGMDVERARRLLAEAGYPDGRGFPDISILYNSEGTHGDIAQSIRRQWLDNLNIDVRLENVETKVFRQRLHEKKYSIARASWIGDYNDVSTFTDKYLSEGENNDSGWKNQRYDDLCAQAAREPDAEKRLAMLTQAEQILVDEQPIIPLYHYVNAYLFRDNVKGVQLDPRLMVMFKSVYVGLMARFIGYRLAQFPLVLAIIYLLTFMLVWVAPGDPFSQNDRKIDEQVIATMKKNYHADTWYHFLGYYPRSVLLHGDFGPSFAYKEWSINDILKSALPVSVALGLLALAIATFAGVSIGTLAAVRRGGIIDMLSLSIALAGISFPSFVTATILLIGFGVELRWFPVGGWGTLRDMVLPAIALSLMPMAYIARLTRVAMIDVLSSDYVRTARAKGLSRGKVIWKHCLRNAFLPVLSYLGPAAAAAMTGSFVVEKVFNIPGLGQHFVNSVLNRDHPLILGTVMIYSLFLLTLNLLVDIAYAFVDPRIDVGAAVK